MARCKRDARVARRVRLHDHPPLGLITPGAARHLRNELECALGASKIGYKERRVRRDDAHKRHERKIEALGNHLRAYEYLSFTARKL
ncbi:hypothetical protein SDC9_208692 [bioreactor metagenome]|uniref:Uncharacterized protein n=1 Tax=bioreactor metagenome TaxID=1076179 RepID=A0A645JE56_9ZZZZ